MTKNLRFQIPNAKSLSTAFTLSAVLVLGGCQQRTVGQLLGKWVGSPDTAAARADREAQKYGETSAQGKGQAIEPDRITDWERYDQSVSLHFVDHERLEMSLSGGSGTDESKPGGVESLTGKWRVVSTTPIGCTIEVETEDGTTVVRRQFQLDWDEQEGQCVGFTWIEVGADRQLGTLYFCRQ